MMYAPDVDPNSVDLTKPTTAFDSCGFKLYSTGGLTYVEKDFASLVTTTAESFFNSAGFKTRVMNELGSNFNVKVITDQEAKNLGVECLTASFSGAEFLTTSVAAIALALMLQ